MKAVVILFFEYLEENFFHEYGDDSQEKSQCVLVCYCYNGRSLPNLAS